GPPARHGGGEAGAEPRGWTPGERETGFEADVRRLGEISGQGPERVRSGLEEFDRVLGGGIVPGAVMLVGGDPGVGKSTLLLQVASRLAAQGRGVLYVSGEESAGQTKLRAERLGVTPDLAVLAEADLELILEAVGEGVPPPRAQAAGGEETAESVVDRLPVEVLFIDSIQATYLSGLPSAPGSVMQVREGALTLTHMAKTRGVAVFLVGHVTKEGNVAGPRTLEHIVDAVLTMEGERFHAHRLLRGVKNRFGSVHEIGVFDMREDGLAEVANPSLLFLGENSGSASGSAVVAGTEGTRSLLMEVQALVHPTRYGIPQRIATGFDGRRLAILLAVLLKRADLDATGSDVFVNVVGGLRVEEPGVDLGVLMAIASSFEERPLGDDLAVFGEIGLGGEIRRVSDPERRIAEAARLGYTRVLLPAATRKDLEGRRWKAPDGCRLIAVGTLREALDAVHRG
ncbi:MAG: DNA repair protein RadA, partial [Candidatus Eisenbacteria bacterium]|nr:DNA repair protein RadA [Candidatus Eisenbacteria bacterium]